MSSNTRVFRTFEEVPEFIRVCLNEGIPASQIQATLREAGLNTKFIDTAFLKVQGAAPSASRAPTSNEYDLQLEPITDERQPSSANQPFKDRRAISRGAIAVRAERPSVPLAPVELDFAPLMTGSRRVENEEIYDPLLQRTVRFEQRASKASLEEDDETPPPRRELPRTLTVTRVAPAEDSSRVLVRFFGLHLGPFPVRTVFWTKAAVLALAVYLAFAFPFNHSRERLSIIDATPITMLPKSVSE